MAVPAPRTATDQDRILLLIDGSEVRLRTAVHADAPLVAALHARCSPETRLARFRTPKPRLHPDELRRLVGDVGDTPVPGDHSVLVLTADGGSAVGLANLQPVDARTGGFAVLVEDAWQGRGLGTALVRRVAELALEQGYQELTAVAPTDNLQVTRLLRRSGLRPTAEIAGGMLMVRAALGRPVVVG
nr:GNAT family N-acetyltransferase [Pseudonocardia acidicola]